MNADEVERYDVIRVADEVVIDLMTAACGGYASVMPAVEVKPQTGPLDV